MKIFFGFILIFITSTSGAEPKATAILKALFDHFGETPAIVLRSAQSFNASVTKEDVQETELGLLRMGTVDSWFYDILIAGSFVDASEDDLLPVIQRKAQELGRFDEQFHNIGTVRRWTRYCIKGGLCGTMWNSEGSLVWKLSHAGIFEVIRDLLDGEDRENSVITPRLETSIGNAVRDNVRVTPERLAETFHVHVEDAKRIKKAVLNISRQPVWFLSFLQEKYREITVLHALVTAVKAENGKHRVRIAGSLSRAVPAWVQVAIKDKNPTKNYSISGEFAYIREEALQRYFNMHASLRRL
jgi:hypothetical protein